MSDPKYVKIGTPAMRVIEECSEIIKAVMKGERFGYLSCNPESSDEETNIDQIKRELCDLKDAIFDLEIGIEK